MPSLESLEQKYHDARETYSEDSSEENYKKYKKAKRAFVDARVEQRRIEEADPDHPRGQMMVTVTDNEEGGE